MTIYGAIDTSENQRLPYSGAAARLAGVKIWWARSTVGWARLDPCYFAAKEQAEDNDIAFGTYGLNWPANRDGRREGRYMLDRITSGASPRPPRFVVVDGELGTSSKDAANYAVPAEVIVINILYFLEVLATSRIETDFYTGPWYLTHPKLRAAFQKYAQELRKYPLIAAEYPFQGRTYELLHGGPMRPAQFDPWIAKPLLPSPPQFPKLPAPWDEDDLLGVQWSSYGKQQGIVSNPAPWDRLDYSAFFRIPGEPPEAGGPRVECEYCGRWQPVGNEICRSCGSILPAPAPTERLAALEGKAHIH